MIRAGSLVKDYFDKRNLSSEKELLNYTGIWNSITGKNIGRSTRPVSLKDGILYVEVEDSIWLYELTMLKEKIIRDFNTVSREITISNIVFRNTGISLREKKPDKELSRFTQKKDSAIQKQKLKKENLRSEQKAEIARLIQYIPASFQQSMKRLLCNFFLFELWKKEKGASICPRCRAHFFVRNDARREQKFCHICDWEQHMQEQ